MNSREKIAFEEPSEFAEYMRDSELAQGLATLNTERAVVSILLNFPAAMDDCQAVHPEHFASELMRDLFSEIRRQIKGYDAVSIAQALSDKVDLADVVAVSHFNDHSPRSIGRHVADLIAAHKSRKLFQLGELAQELAFEKTPVQERMDKVSAALLELEDREDYGDWVSAHESAVKHIELIEQREAGTVSGMETGLPDLDRLMDGGLQRGNLIVIGARPAMGKSALGLTIGLHMAQQYTVGFISMEMSRSDIADRQAAILGRVSISHIKQPRKGLEYERVVDAIEQSKTRKFYVVEQGGLNLVQVKSKAKALKRRHGLDVLVVDYIGLMSGMDAKQSRAYQIEEISRGFKTLAKDLDIALICLAQVNRGAADKGNSPPSLHELRDSGAIEQDADAVAFIHRPIQANPDLGADFEHYALLRIAKNRQGRCGDVHLYYVGDQTKFAAWSGSPPQKQVAQTQQKRGMQ